MNYPVKLILASTLTATALAGCGGSSSSDSSDPQTVGTNPSTIVSGVSILSSDTVGMTACPNGGIVVTAGIDENSNGTLDATEVDVTDYVCHGLVGSTGVTGADGTNGSLALLEIVDELPGLTCATGGKKVTSGNDFDGDTVLDPSEILSTKYICNGVDGINGSNGSDSLVVPTLEAAGSNCANGGQKFETGIDTSGNGSLELSEVIITEYICNGIAGIDGVDGTNGTSGYNALVDMTTLASGSVQCTYGGILIETGLDTGMDGTLDPSEVTSSGHVCNGGPMWKTVSNSGMYLGVDGSGLANYDLFTDKSTGDVYILYNISGLNVAKYDPALDSWNPVGAANFGDGSIITNTPGDHQLFVYFGTPYVAALNSNSTSISVWKYTGSVWELLGGGAMPGTVYTNNMPYDFVVIKDEPYVAFVDISAIPASTDSHMVKFDVTLSAWVEVGRRFAVDVNGSDATNAISMTSDAGMLYYMAGRVNEGPSVFQYDGTSFTEIGNNLQTPNQVGLYYGGTSITVDNNGVIYVAFLANNVAKSIACGCNAPYVYVWSNDGGGWSPLGTEPVSDGNAEEVNITVANDGMIYLAYRDRSTSPFVAATVKRYNGFMWETLGGKSPSLGDVFDVTLTQSNGVPYVAYQDAGITPPAGSYYIGSINKFE